VQRGAADIRSLRSSYGLEVLMVARSHERGRTWRGGRLTGRTGRDRKNRAERKEHAEQPADQRLVYPTMTSH
jgi:hypothetical protein